MTPLLNRTYLKDELMGTEIADYPAEIINYPERVIQVGEGNFLRGFVDWMFHQMNKKGYFKGRIVVIKPRAGKLKDLNDQDGLFTLFLRGREKGEVVEKKEIITSISRGIETYNEWDKVLKLARNPEIEFVISNTTEAGIIYLPDDRIKDTPPESFPAKLTVYLYERYRYFDGDKDKGLVIIPTELIERNGDSLKEIVIKLSRDWNLPSQFIDWVNDANYFLNTLVDRIVTGYPGKEINNIEKELGYRDKLLNTGEIFHLWVIEGNKELKDRLPFHKVGLNVKWVDDLTPYRVRKVRILNGAHTSTVPVAYLAGIDTVREAVNDDLCSNFIKKTLFEEIIPTLEGDKDELEDFAKEVLERFNNPFIEHKWFDISLNSISKFKVRVLPSMLNYISDKGIIPQNLSFSLAALLYFYKGTDIRDGKLICSRKGEEYGVNDNIETLDFFRKIWLSYERGEAGLEEIVKNIFANIELWGQNLNSLPELKDRVLTHLKEFDEYGMKKSLHKLLSI